MAEEGGGDHDIMNIKAYLGRNPAKFKDEKSMHEGRHSSEKVEPFKETVDQHCFPARQ